VGALRAQRDQVGEELYIRNSTFVPYLEAVIKVSTNSKLDLSWLSTFAQESMRMHSPVNFTCRVVTQPGGLQCEGKIIPYGANVIIPSTPIQRYSRSIRVC
jgi:cytochrome P450